MQELRFSHFQQRPEAKAPGSLWKAISHPSGAKTDPRKANIRPQSGQNIFHVGLHDEPSGPSFCTLLGSRLLETWPGGMREANKFADHRLR